jgi:hypothetical protein
MTTCFATVASLSCFKEPVTQEIVLELVKKSPRERLEEIPSRLPEASEAIDKILEQYLWFIGMTGLTEAELHDYISDKVKCSSAFKKANEYGDSIYELLKLSDKEFGYMRFLVV